MSALDESNVTYADFARQRDRNVRDSYKSKFEWRNELLYIFPIISLGTIAISIGCAILNPTLNGEPANPFATPQDLLPEWYLYPVYQLVRNFPNKALGIIIMGLVAIGLLLIPFIENADRLQYPIRRTVSIIIFAASVVTILWLGIGATYLME
jgi:cytochrome b6-f complex subunit 4